MKIYEILYSKEENPLIISYKEIDKENLPFGFSQNGIYSIKIDNHTSICYVDFKKYRRGLTEYGDIIVDKLIMDIRHKRIKKILEWNMYQ